MFLIVRKSLVEGVGRVDSFRQMGRNGNLNLTALKSTYTLGSGLDSDASDLSLLTTAYPSPILGRSTPSGSGGLFPSLSGKSHPARKVVRNQEPIATRIVFALFFRRSEKRGW